MSFLRAFLLLSLYFKFWHHCFSLRIFIHVFTHSVRVTSCILIGVIWGLLFPPHIIFRQSIPLCMFQPPNSVWKARSKASATPSASKRPYLLTPHVPWYINTHSSNESVRKSIKIRKVWLKTRIFFFLKKGLHDWRCLLKTLLHGYMGQKHLEDGDKQSRGTLNPLKCWVYRNKGRNVIALT